jgi:hypothetical protein
VFGSDEAEFSRPAGEEPLSSCRDRPHLDDHRQQRPRPRQELIMLWTIFGILLVLWLLGIVSAYTFGGFIHVLLALAIAVVLMRVIQGQQPME